MKTNTVTYEVIMQVEVDSDLSESEINELFSNLDIDSSVAPIHSTTIETYHKL